MGNPGYISFKLIVQKEEKDVTCVSEMLATNPGLKDLIYSTLCLDLKNNPDTNR